LPWFGLDQPATTLLLGVVHIGIFLAKLFAFQIVKGLAFFDRKENKDVLAYIRLLLNPHDNLSFLRAVNEPARGVGKVSLEHLQSYADAHEIVSPLVSVREIAAAKVLQGAVRLHPFTVLLSSPISLPPGDYQDVMDMVLYLNPRDALR
jgi:superfamily I DNA/RNA helicase